MALADPNPDISDEEVPVIDLSAPESEVIPQIAKACSTFGFFQVLNHGFPLESIKSFREQMVAFFDLPYETKSKLWRDEQNSRGYFDNELTKRRRDWKECLDVGVPGSRDWNVPEEEDENACLDGFNRFPDPDVLPEFRPTVMQYFESCAELSGRIADLMGKGLGVELRSTDEKKTSEEKSAVGDESKSLLQCLREEHTSYLRMNHYPPCTSNEQPPPLGISPHHDAGFLTVLVQDDDCHSLQVARHDQDEKWVTVKPVPGAFTINTGDMAMIWSNGKYRAPLHRVLTDSERHRYSAPFFYNPGYTSLVSPLPELVKEQPARYRPCSWGYFRAVRFAGDLTDLGTEIQVADYGVGSDSEHLEKQAIFLQEADFHKSFSVEKYRSLLEM